MTHRPLTDQQRIVLTACAMGGLRMVFTRGLANQKYMMGEKEVTAIAHEMYLDDDITHVRDRIREEKGDDFIYVMKLTSWGRERLSHE